MKKIFIPLELTDKIIIPPDVAHHLLHVFRYDISKPLLVTGSDKKTGLYKITQGKTEDCLAEIIEYKKTNINSKTSKEVILVQAFLKSDKFEWVLQKACELNVTEIYGVATKNCVVKYTKDKLSAKQERWQKILMEASQQCGREHLPQLTTDENLSSILEIEHNSLCLLASEDELQYTLKDILSDTEARRIVIFIGPEGSFSAEELQLFKVRNIPFVSLGNTILRAETASITAISMINYECKL